MSDARIEPFEIAIDDAVLEDLARRLAAMRWPDALDDVGWDQWNALGAAQDIRAYYEEAALQLVDVTGARQTESWFYQKTETGQMLRRAAGALKEAGAPDMVPQYIAPMTQMG